MIIINKAIAVYNKIFDKIIRVIFDYKDFSAHLKYA